MRHPRVYPNARKSGARPYEAGGVGGRCGCERGGRGGRREGGRGCDGSVRPSAPGVCSTRPPRGSRRSARSARLARPSWAARRRPRADAVWKARGGGAVRAAPRAATLPPPPPRTCAACLDRRACHGRGGGARRACRGRGGGARRAARGVPRVGGARMRGVRGPTPSAAAAATCPLCSRRVPVLRSCAARRCASSPPARPTPHCGRRPPPTVPPPPRSWSTRRLADARPPPLLLPRRVRRTHH